MSKPTKNQCHYSNGDKYSKRKTIFVSDLFSERYNNSFERAKNILVHIIKNNYDCCLIVPSSLIPFVTNKKYKIENKGKVYLQFGITEEVYFVTKSEYTNK